MFVTVEGIEGSGKSTQAARLAAALGPETVLTQEPGGTVLGRAIRKLLLDPAHGALVAEAEVLLFFADRAQHVGELIRPALASGRTVVSDRYTDSSVAYQGYGRGIPRDVIASVARAATGGLVPDVTLLVDVPAREGLARVARRGSRDRMEAEAVAFHERVREGYLEMAAREPGRFVRVDGLGLPDEVEARIRAALADRGVRFPVGR